MQSDNTLKPCVVEKGEWLEIRFFFEIRSPFRFVGCIAIQPRTSYPKATAFLKDAV